MSKWWRTTESARRWIDLAPGLSPILADANQMERVISIVIANSREAMPKGGKLTLSTGDRMGRNRQAASGSGMESFPQVVVSISDTGVGMNDEVKARLFEPFFTTKPIGKGAGLRRSTVYGIVKAGGGKIQVESRSGGETILLVEDDVDVRFLLNSMLKADGYSVLEAKDGEQALELAATHQSPINLVLTDLQLPKVGGRKLVEKLLAENPSIKAMFISGFGREDFPDAQVHGLPVSFLEKPFKPKSLVRQIRKVLDS